MLSPLPRGLRGKKFGEHNKLSYTSDELSTIIIRPAQRQDARRIAQLFRMSSGGIADYVWSKLAEPGEDLLNVGQRRYERDGTDFSFHNCTVVHCKGRIIAMMLAYPMHSDPSYVQTDPVLAPYRKLEEDNSYYISAVAVEPHYRRRGIAAELMLEAEIACRRQGLSSLSLIVFEQNTIAKQFYEVLGYTEKAREKVVPHPLINYSGDALLMVKTIG